MSEKNNSVYCAPGAPKDQSEDYRVIATALDGQVRAVAIRSTQICQRAKEIFDLSPVATVALGRFMTGALLLSSNLKNAGDTLTAHIHCEGPIKGVTVICDSSGHVKGYCVEPIVETSYYKPGKINVAAAIEKGLLTVIKDSGFKEPYVGSVELISGEIGEDFAYYLGVSEQTKSVIALGVLLTADGVKHAGGFMIQLMPGAEDRIVDYLEKRATGGFPDVTYLFEEGFNPEQILDLFLGDPQIKYLSAQPVSYRCDCSKMRMERALIALGKVELKSLIQENKPVEISCHFCNAKYSFSPVELTELYSG